MYKVLSRETLAPLPGFRVTVHREPDQVDMRRQHRHDFYEIVWVLAGGGVHMTGGFRHRLGAGDVLVLDPRRAHGYERTEGLHLVNLLLDPMLFPSWHRAFGHLPGFQRLFVLAGERWEQSVHTGEAYEGRLRITGRDAEDLTDWIDRIEAETHSSASESVTLAEAWALQVVGLLSRRAGSELSTRPGRPTDAAGIHRLLSWIELHVQDPLAVEDLAREAGMSVRSLQRNFRKRTGQTPAGYVLSRRMARAEQLLRRRTDLSVSEVGRRCGFANASHFSAVVRDQLGCTPRALRP